MKLIYLLLILPFLANATIINTTIALNTTEFTYFELLYTRGILSYDIKPTQYNNLISVIVVNSENLILYKNNGNYEYYSDLSRERVYHTLLHDIKFNTVDEKPPLYIIILNNINHEPSVVVCML